MKKLLTACLAAATVAAAHGQDFSSFQSTTFTDVYVTALSTTSYEVAFGPSATVGGVGLDKIFGFWSITPMQGGLGTVSLSSQNSWDTNSKDNSTGEIAGWTNNSKSNAILANDIFTFNYTSLSNPSDTYGFHVLLSNGNTLYVTGAVPGLPPGFPNSVPAPAGLATFALGALGLIRRRFTKL